LDRLQILKINRLEKSKCLSFWSYQLS